MQMNLAIDFIIRFVPFISDFADTIYKCNTRNAALLENELRNRGESRLRDINRRYEVDLSLPEIYDNISDENFAHGGPPPRYTSRKEPRRPERTYDSPNTRNGGWFGGRREADLESQVIPLAQPPRPGQSILQHCQCMMVDGRRSTANGGIHLVHLLTERVSLDTYCSTIHSNENGASLIVGLVMSAYFVQSELCK